MNDVERERAFEYILDRKNNDIKELEKALQTLREHNERDKGILIAAEIVLFVLGMFVGVVFMKTYGWKPF